MDLTVLAIAKKYADSLSLGFSSVTDLGNGKIRFTLTSGDHLDVTVPTVKGDKGDTATIEIGTVTSGDTPSVTNSGDEHDAVLNFTLVKGDKGDTGNRGAIGVGITSVEKQGTSGLVDTYKITYSDGTSSTFEIVNGANVTKTSQLTNDSNFVTTTAINLVNYYLKSEVYNKSAIDEMLRNVGAGLSVKIVSELPTTDISGTTIYLINTSGSQYNQYMYIDDEWANLGSTAVDMSSYYNKTQIDNKLLEYITASAMLSQLLQYTKTSDLSAVAISNSYNDLDDLPDIPSVEGFAKARQNLGEVDLDDCVTEGIFTVTTTSDNLPDIDLYGSYVDLEVLATTELVSQQIRLVTERDEDELEPMIWSRVKLDDEDEWRDWVRALSNKIAYTKPEVDNLLDAKADKSTTYTKSETDALLDDKADSDDVDTALALKADKSTTYTKTEVDTKLAEKVDTSIFKADTLITEDLDTLTAGKSTMITPNVAHSPCDYGYCICFVANWNWFFQLTFSTLDAEIYIRTKINSSTWNAWKKIA